MGHLEINISAMRFLFAIIVVLTVFAVINAIRCYEGILGGTLKDFDCANASCITVKEKNKGHTHVGW
jgi:hypothetical protein